METPIEFDLNGSLRRWRERLSESPHFRSENLDELESHLRDSIATLQSQGLSAEEAFLIGARRVGAPAALELAFAGENGGDGWRDRLRRLRHAYGGRLIHLLILGYFTMGCWFLWGTLKVGEMILRTLSFGMPGPGFTLMFMSLMPYWYLPPGLAALYCGFVWTRGARQSSWAGFFACATAILMLLLLPTVIAVVLPLLDYLHRTAVAP